MDAADTITEDTFYKIDEIFIKVSPNPGPKTYTVVIKPVPPPIQRRLGTAPSEIV